MGATRTIRRLTGRYCSLPVWRQLYVRDDRNRFTLHQMLAVLLDMGARYPNQTFTVWIPASAYSVTTDRSWLEALKGKTVDVKGQIQEYKGKPEIRVIDESQVTEVTQ